MAFTYDENLPTAKDWVRLYIGDTVTGQGVRPDDRNFSDEEVNAILTEQGGDKSKATAVLLGVLSTEWSKVADITVGARHESLSDVAAAYRARAEEQAAISGMQGVAFSSGLVRISEPSTGTIA